MAIPAVAAPLVILKRRKIGALFVVAGVVMVVLGLLLPLTNSALADRGGLSTDQIKTPVLTITVPNSGSMAVLNAGNSSGVDTLRHTFDHPLLSSGSLGSMIVDLALRGGMVLIVAGALLCIVFNVLPLMRGLVGLAAGLGLMGTAIEMGVILGQGARTQAICSGTACHVDLHAGIWLIAAGFTAALAGGAVGALRPLAGLISGLSFTFTGVMLGAGVAFLIVQQKVLDIVSSLPGVAN